MPRSLLLLALALLLSNGVRADHADFVVVAANASQAYAERKFAGGSPRPETYVFFQGKYFGGATRDPSIDRASFLAIARTLAPDLARQNYLPTRQASAADLLIVVNWGTTVTDPTADKNDPEAQWELQDLISSVRSGSNDANAHLAVANTNAMGQQSQATYYSHLLGYDATLQREGRMDWARPDRDALEASHLSELIDERYFVILLAYDYQRILRDNGALRDSRHRVPPQPRPVWTVRMNIRAAGNNFELALPAMTAAASSYFGKQLDDLVSLPASVGSRAHVEVGEPRVMDTGK